MGTVAATLEARIIALESKISTAYLSRDAWEFGVVGSSPLTLEFHLRSDGVVTGYDHDHERFWAFRDGALELYTKDKALSCRLSPIASHEEAEKFETFEGQFLLSSGGARHFLRRKKTNVGGFLRTHFWDEGVASAHALLRSALNQDIHVAADMTSDFIMPTGMHVAPHRLSEFSRYGIVLYPSPQRAMWYNGDLVLYDLYLRYEFSHFFVSEYDVALRLNANTICQNLIDQSYDFAAFNTGVAYESWMWDRVHREWDAFETAEMRTVRELTPIYKSFFPIVFISRRAIAHLFARRLELSRLYRRGPGVPVPFCESFVPTELLRAGFKIGDLNELIPGPKHVTLDDALTWSEFSSSNLTCAHPVLSGVKFVRKLIDFSSIKFGSDLAQRIEWLHAQSHRIETSEQQAVFEADMKALKS